MPIVQVEAYKPHALTILAVNVCPPDVHLVPPPHPPPPPQDVVEVMAPTYTMGLHDVDTSTKWTTSDVMCYFVSTSSTAHTLHRCSVYACGFRPMLLNACTVRVWLVQHGSWH